ncbi:MAG: cytochrome oxidase small assembly protein [Burkholderiaceae bacterium]|nr:cytochrome oxidase small assembly protein [Burkholderiaceae bacterium]
MSERSNLRTALILASIAIAMFVGVIVDHWLNGG